MSDQPHFLQKDLFLEQSIVMGVRQICRIFLDGDQSMSQPRVPFLKHGRGQGPTAIHGSSTQPADGAKLSVTPRVPEGRQGAQKNKTRETGCTCTAEAEARVEGKFTWVDASGNFE